jgi:hypothetical protein
MKNKILVFSLILILIYLNLTIISGCVKTGEAVTYVNLSLNPNIEIVLDTADKVVSVNAINEDGELLFAQENFAGERVQNIIYKLVDLSAKSGLLDVNNINNAVYLSVVNERAEYANNLFEKLKDVCDNYFKTNGIYAMAVSGQLPEEIITLATEYDLPPGHLRLMLKAIEVNPDLTIAELTIMPISDIIKIVNSAFLGVGKIYSKDLKDAYKAERIALRETYQANIEALFGAEYVNLLDELEFLESQLEVAEGEALETLKNAITAKEGQIETLKLQLETSYADEFNALKEQYELDKKALIDNYIDQAKTYADTLKTNLQNRIAQNEDKLELRKQYAKTRLNNFREKYETFKALREADLFNFLKTQIEETDRLTIEVKEDLLTALAEAEKYYKLY